MRVVLLLLVLVSVAYSVDVTHVVIGQNVGDIIGAGEKTAKRVAIWNNAGGWSTYGTPNFGGTVNGIITLGANGDKVLAYGSISSVDGQTAYGLAYYNGARWCVPQSLPLLSYTKSNLNFQYTYSCALDNTMGGVTIDFERPAQYPCNRSPLTTAVQGSTGVNVWAIFQDEDDANKLFLTGSFNMVGNHQESVAGLLAVTFTESAAEPFAWLNPGRPAVGNQTPISPVLGSVRSREVCATCGVTKSIRIKKPVPPGGATPNPEYWWLDFETQPADDTAAATRIVLNPASDANAPSAANCANGAWTYQQTVEGESAPRRVFLCLSGTTFRRALWHVDTTSALPYPAYSDNSRTTVWETLNMTTTTAGSGTIPRAIRNIPGWTDVAYRHSDKSFFLVGDFDTTSRQFQNPTQAANFWITGSRWRNIIGFKDVIRSNNNPLWFEPYNAEGDANGFLRFSKWIDADDVENYSNGWQYSNKWQTSTLYGEWPNANGTDTGVGGFDRIALDKTNGDLFIAGGYRDVTSGAGSFNQLTNPIAGQREFRVFKMPASTTSATLGSTALGTPLGNRFGPNGNPGNAPWAFSRPSANYLYANAGKAYVSFTANNILYNPSYGPTTNAASGYGKVWSRRYTATLTNGMAAWDGSAWSPAFGGWISRINTAGTAQAGRITAVGATTWNKNGDLYLYDTNLVLTYNTPVNHIAYGNINDDDDNDEWKGGLLWTNRITLRSDDPNAANWASSNNGDGAAGTVNSVFLYDGDSNGDRQVLIGGNWDWIGADVTSASVAVVNLQAGTAANLGEGLFTFSSTSTAAQARLTGAAEKRKWLAAGTVDAIVGNRGGAAGAWAIAAGTFNTAGAYTGDQYSVAVPCATRNIALYEKNVWTELAGGCNGNVRTLYLSDGQLFIAGSFTACGGVSGTRNMARLEISPGQSLEGFDKKWKGLAIGARGGTVYTFATLGDWLYVSGSFSDVAGLKQTAKVAKYHIGDDQWDWDFSECFGICDGRRNPNNQAFHQQITIQPNQGDGSPAFGTDNGRAMWSNDEWLYVADSSGVYRYDQDNWEQIDNGASFGAAPTYKNRISGYASDRVMLVGTSAYAKNYETYTFQSRGMDVFDVEYNEWTRGQAGFNGLGGADPVIEQIAGASMLGVSAVLMMALMALAMLF